MITASPTGPICAVMVHVTDVAAGLVWYQQAFPQAELLELTGPLPFSILRLAGVDLEIVPADEKVSAGPSGTVVYWSVTDFHAALQHFSNLGGGLYRGPLAIEDQQWMAQIRDPWGNCIGLRGPVSAA